MIDRLMYSALAAFSVMIHNAFGPPDSRDDKKSDRGDVPGWVMITVKTAL